MILFINGSFGVGKSTVADIVQRQLPNSLVYDPEEVGFMLRNILKSIDTRDDFQDYPMWPELVVEIAKTLKHSYDKVLIIPMTVWREEYFLEITNGLKELDKSFCHFCLTAPEAVIRSRLNKRAENHDWALTMTHTCVEALKSDMFTKHIDSTQHSSQEIADLIVSEIKQA